MLVYNSKHAEQMETSRVKFISYTGRYPNLCHGVLTLEIDGEVVMFGHNFDFNNYIWDSSTFKDEIDNPHYESFWHTGGSIQYRKRDYYPEYGDWKINVDELPEKYRELAPEIDEVFNSNVPQGCCGGCI